MLPTRTTFDLLCGMWSLLREAGAVTGDLTRLSNGDGTAAGTKFGPSAQAVATSPLW